MYVYICMYINIYFYFGQPYWITKLMRKITHPYIYFLISIGCTFLRISKTIQDRVFNLRLQIKKKLCNLLLKMRHELFFIKTFPWNRLNLTFFIKQFKKEKKNYHRPLHLTFYMYVCISNNKFWKLKKKTNKRKQKNQIFKKCVCLWTWK